MDEYYKQEPKRLEEMLEQKGWKEPLYKMWRKREGEDQEELGVIIEDLHDHIVILEKQIKLLES